MGSERFRYKAFVSYSHRDQAVAQWLHRALESYRTPAYLVGRETATGLIEKRLGPIFRDRDELPVAADLTGQINEALAATQFLIVMCSPASAQSKWVNQEVINFKRLKGAGSIIAVIVDGEPYASTKPGQDALECFAPGLRYHVSPDGTLTDQPAEPIAADLRPGKDGKRMVKLKVIAGLLGVGLDELVQRETQRRQRFMTAVTFASLLGIGVMGALTFNAIAARNDAEIAQEKAERQKAQAEGLIEFMLGDLRKKLQPVGRLDVLDAVGGKAQDYFQTLKPDELDSETLGRQARTLHLIGEISDQRGDLEKALQNFTKANAITSELLARQPKNTTRLFEHAQSTFWVGQAHWQRRELKDAESKFREYLSLSEQLLSQEPDHSAWQIEYASACTNVGSVLIKRGDASAAIDFFTKAKQQYTSLLERTPEDASHLYSLAQTSAWLADAYNRIGDLKKVRDERLIELGIYKKQLEKDPLNKTLLKSALNSQRELAVANFDLGNTTDALDMLSDAAQQSRELLQSDKANTVWADIHARILLSLSEAYFHVGNTEAFLKNLNAAKGIADVLLAAQPNMVSWHIALRAKANRMSAQYLYQQQDYRTAIELATNQITDLDALKIKHADNLEIDTTRAALLVLLGNALDKAGQQKRATDSWTGAARFIEKLRDNASARDKFIELQARVQLKETEPALRLNQWLFSVGFQRPDFVELQKVIRTQTVENRIRADRE